MYHHSGVSACLVDLEGVPLPTCTHNGVTYAIAQAGTSFEVKVERALHSPGFFPHLKVHASIDGTSVGYSKIVTCGKAARFEGFLESRGGTGTDTYSTFKFASVTTGVGAEGAGKGGDATVVQHPDELQTGRVKLTACNTMPSVAPPSTSMADTALKAKTLLPETKKFFLNPSLGCDKGKARALASNWGAYDDVGGTIWAQEIRYETADRLVLRHILDAGNPAHAPLLATCTLPSVREALGLPPLDGGDQGHGRGRGSNAGGGSSSRRRGRENAAGNQQPARRSRHQQQAPGVKQEGGQARVKHERGADDGPVTTVDLTGRAVPKPLEVDGRPVGRDEVAFCNLADSSDEEGEGQGRWQVAKKRVVDGI